MTGVPFIITSWQLFTHASDNLPDRFWPSAKMELMIAGKSRLKEVAEQKSKSPIQTKQYITLKRKQILKRTHSF